MGYHRISPALCFNLPKLKRNTNNTFRFWTNSGEVQTVFREDKSFYRPFVCTKGLFSAKKQKDMKYTRVLNEEIRKQREKMKGKEEKRGRVPWRDK